VTPPLLTGRPGGTGPESLARPTDRKHDGTELDQARDQFPWCGRRSLRSSLRQACEWALIAGDGEFVARIIDRMIMRH